MILNPIRTLIKNIPTLLLALALSLMVWVFAVSDSDPVEERAYPRTVEIEMLGVNEDMLVSTASGESKTAAVTLRAPRSVWDRLLNEPDMLRAVVELDGLASGEYQLPVQIQLGAQPVKVVSFMPQEISLKIEELSQRTLPINIVLLGDPAIGFQAEMPVPSIEKAFVSGPRTQVEKVSGIQGTLDISRADGKIVRAVELRAVGENGLAVERVTVDPVRVVVTQNITQRGGYRNLAVKVVVRGQIANGYRLTNISAIPAAVTLFSSNPSLVNQLPGYIETEQIDVTNAKANVERRVFLSMPPGVSAVGDQMVQVSIGIAAIEGSLTLSGMPIEVTGLESGFSASTSPDRLDVILSGPMPVLEKLSAEKVRVVLDMSGAETGKYQKEPRVELESTEVRVESIIPKMVEVEVGKELENDIKKSPTQQVEKDGGKESVPTPFE